MDSRIDPHKNQVLLKAFAAAAPHFEETSRKLAEFIIPLLPHALEMSQKACEFTIPMLPHAIELEQRLAKSMLPLVFSIQRVLKTQPRSFIQVKANGGAIKELPRPNVSSSSRVAGKTIETGEKRGFARDCIAAYLNDTGSYPLSASTLHNWIKEGGMVKGWEGLGVDGRNVKSRGVSFSNTILNKMINEIVNKT